METSTDKEKEQTLANEEIYPDNIPILPLRNTVGFPYTLIPLVVGVPRSLKLIEDALKSDSYVGLLASKDKAIDEPLPGQIHEVGTIAKIHRVMKTNQNMLQVAIEGIDRFVVKEWIQTEPYLKAQIELLPEEEKHGLEIDALEKSLRDLSMEIVALMPNIQENATYLLMQAQKPHQLIYLMAANVQMHVRQGQKLLEADGLEDKFRMILEYLDHEKQVLTLEQKIRTETQEKMDKAQQEYYLREQLKTIKKRLGETEETELVENEYTGKILDANMNEEAEKEAFRELKRLSNMPVQAAEYSIIKTYLDWLVELPWSVLSKDNLDIHRARKILDEDHYDLTEIKDRIIEYLAVQKLIQTRKKEKGASDLSHMGAIICFVGPPGVGKTSLGKSIARALDRQFTRMSLGGIRDEAEIRGHRRTYIGAMPGRIVQGIKRAGTRNPVFMLDEADKIGIDWRGDPSSALLEVLDPAQNNAFRDHYLDVDFDLSDVMFIMTANQTETIPSALKDRMEIIRLEGYTDFEKLKIAQKYLVPRQIEANGLNKDEIVFSEKVLYEIIQDYTREAGVRNLERRINTMCRKNVVKIVGQTLEQIEIQPKDIRKYLRKEKFESETSQKIEIPGIATGLAVTAVGGEILFIEATCMSGNGRLELTGQLGDVMRESARIAYSFVRSRAKFLKIDADRIEKSDIHIHVPAGATPKDGPSAGIAMVLSIASLLTGRPVRHDIGVTGEVTLSGRVMPVGGIKMKVLAAHRAGLKTVILPRRNERDLEDLPPEILNQDTIGFVMIERIDEAIDAALVLESEDENFQPKTPRLICG